MVGAFLLLCRELRWLAIYTNDQLVTSVDPMSDDQRRGRRLTAEARRAQIVAVATALIAQHGFHNVTIQQIADACGIVKTAVIRHFPSKPDILVAVLETRDAEDAAAAGFDIHHDPQTREAFFESLDKTVAHNFERRELLRLYTVLGAESLNADHPAHDYFLRRQQTSIAAIRDAGADSVAYSALHLRPGAREWYWAWLEREHPDLVPRYREVYGTGSYADKRYRAWLAARVRPLLRKYGLERPPRLVQA